MTYKHFTRITLVPFTILLLIIPSIIGESTIFHQTPTDSSNNDKTEFIRDPKQTILDNNDHPAFLNDPNTMNGYFTSNDGQWNPELYFIADTSFGHVGFGLSCVFYDIKEKYNGPTSLESIDQYLEKNLSSSLFENENIEPTISGCIVKLSFDNSRVIVPKGLEPLNHKSNYFYGNDPKQWVTGVQSYRSIIFDGLWDGIDLIFYFNDQGLKYEFVIQPKFRCEDIKITVSGHNNLQIIDSELVIDTPLGIPIIDKGLNIFHKDDPRDRLLGNFKLIDEDTYSFDLKLRSIDRELVIDPVIYSTVICREKHDYGLSLEVDENGSAYASGLTESKDFPTTEGAYDSKHGGDMDAVVFKLNSSGHELLYSTFIGGSDDDYCMSLALDQKGNVYLTGVTRSSNFPIDIYAFDITFNGYSDSYVLKLNQDGNAIEYSTYIGGEYYDRGNDIEVNQDGEAYTIGYTYSRDFPLSYKAYDRKLSGIRDAFINKLSDDGRDIIISTYIGGSDNETGKNLELDFGGNIYAGGETWSDDFPVTPGSYDAHLFGDSDIFVINMNSAGSVLLYSTYIGGADDEICTDIELDQDNNLYITGKTESKNFPLTDRAYDSKHDGVSEIFILMLTASGSRLRYSTLLGDDGFEYAYALALDQDNNVYITGYTSSEHFPITINAYDPIFNGDEDMIIVKLSYDCSDLLYSSYFGGSDHEAGLDIEMGNGSKSYIAGNTYSSNFPVTHKAYGDPIGGEPNFIIVNFAFPCPPDPPVNIQTSSDDCCVNLNWDEPLFDGGSTIRGYKIYRKKGSNDYKKIAEIWNGTSYSDIGLINGQTYYYKICAVNEIGEGSRSEKVVGIPKTRPNSPENVKGLSGKGFINLTWSEPVNNGGANITGYAIYRGIDPGSEKLLKTVNGTNTSYNDTTVVNGVRYYYYVNALNEMGESFVNDKVNLIPLGVPNPPIDVKAWVFKGYIKITWRSSIDDGGKDIVFFNIYKGTDKKNISLLTKVEREDLKFEDKNLKDGKEYFYYITAENELGESGPSKIVNGTAVIPKTEKNDTDYTFMIVFIIAMIIICIGLFVIKRKREQRRKMRQIADYTKSVPTQPHLPIQQPQQPMPMSMQMPMPVPMQNQMTPVQVQVQQYQPQPGMYDNSLYPPPVQQGPPIQQSQPIQQPQQPQQPQQFPQGSQESQYTQFNQYLQYAQNTQQPDNYNRPKKPRYY
jgi:fibronectin type 3 domain-containing protein